MPRPTALTDITIPEFAFYRDGALIHTRTGVLAPEALIRSELPASPASVTDLVEVSSEPAQRFTDANILPASTRMLR